MGISGVGVMEDESNRIELHTVPNLHTDGMLVALLPAQGVLFQADFTLPQPGAEANPFVKTLARYIEESDVQFEQYLAVHAAQVEQTRNDLLATIANEWELESSDMHSFSVIAAVMSQEGLFRYNPDQSGLSRN